MSVKQKTLDKLSKKVKDKFKHKYKLSSLDYVLGDEVKTESTTKPVAPTSPSDENTATQVILNGQPV